ncbi:HAMP domain-containing protein [Amycolatopsis sp. NPDC051373]|uniref:HAMP domain-containing protein n=1 Tax=Amycolatopsis sp. NPDC051373 TaxID=3155801 RepID=UPI00344D4857
MATTFVLLVVVAVFTAVYLSTAGPLSLLHADEAASAVSGEVAADQQRATTALAQSAATSAASVADDLQIAASSGVFDTVDDAALLTRLGETYPEWRGTVLYDRAKNKVLAAHGEPVPVETLRGVAVVKLTLRPVARSGDAPLVLTAFPLGGARAGRLLVVSAALRETTGDLDKAARQQVRLVTTEGAVLHSLGTAVPKQDTAAQELLTRAASAAAAGQSGVLTGDAGGDPGRPVAPVVSYAPVTSAEIGGSLGLSVVSLSRVPVDPVPARWPGLIPAAALLGLALAGFVLLRRAVVAPVRRLRTDALAIAAGVLAERVRQSRIREVNRVTTAFECYQAKLRRRKPAASVKPFLSAQLVLVLVSLALLGWSGAVAATLGRQHAEVSPALLSEHGVRVARSADNLRRSLVEGLTDLRSLARLAAGKQPDQVRGMLGQLADSESRFRSVYVADAQGGVVLQAGRESLREPGKLPAGEGLHQHNTSGRVPVVYAFTPLPGSANTLVGEYDVPRMAELLGSAGGRLRVVDEGKRTIADTEGYLAFAPLTDPTLIKNVDAARSGKDARETTSAALVAAQRLATDGTTASLKWVVVAEQPVGSLGLADNTVRDGARVAALLVAVVALLLFGWHLLIVVRPLRRVGDAAVRIADGDTGDVVYPQRHDEIGTIASCVEICRQALADGADRLGEVRRPAGAATDKTELFQRVRREPGPRRAKPRAAQQEPAPARKASQAEHRDRGESGPPRDERRREPAGPRRRPPVRPQQISAAQPRTQNPPPARALTAEEQARRDYLRWLDEAGV